MADPSTDKRRYVNVYLDLKTIERIDNYRFDHHIPSRTEAIRRLILAALPPVRQNNTKKS